MLEKLRMFFSAPVFEDEGVNFNARNLNVVLLSVFVGIAITILRYIALKKFSQGNAGVIFLVTGVVVFGAYILFQKRHILMSSMIAIIVLTLMPFALILMSGNGIHDTAIMILPVVVVITSMLLPWQGLIGYVAFLALAFGVLVRMEVNRNLVTPFSSLTTNSDFTDALTILTVAALMSGLLVTSLRRNLRRLSEALKERGASEERYRLISNLSSDYVFSSTVHKDGTITHDWQSGAFESISGYTPEEFLAHGGWRSTLHPDDLIVDDQMLEKMFSNQRAAGELRVITKSGASRWVQIYARPVWDDNENHLIGIYGAVQNIDEQKLAEEKLRRQADQMTALYDIGLTITSNFDLDHILHDLFERCRQLLPLDRFYIAVYNESLGTIQHPLFYDGNQNAFIQVDDRNIKTDPGLSGHVILSKETLYLSDSADPTIQEKYNIVPTGGVPSRSYVGVPMFFHDTIIGAISMQKFKTNAYSPDQIRLLETIATQAAVAIENARLYESEQERRQEAEILRASLASVVGILEFSDIIQRILDQIRLVVPYDSASIWRVEGNRQIFIAGRDLPSEIQTSGWEITVGPGNSDLPIFKGEVPYILSNNVQEELTDFGEPPHNYINSWLSLPLRTRGKLIGVICLDGKQKNQFNSHHADLAVTFADQVAIALENASLYLEIQQELSERKIAEQAARRKMEEMALLNRLGISITSGMDFYTTLFAIQTEINRLIKADAFYIAIYNDKTDIVSYPVFFNQGGFLTEKDRRLHDFPGLTGAVIFSGQTLYLPDMMTAEVWEKYHPYDSNELILHTFLGIPLNVNGRVFGMLSVQSEEIDAYSLDQVNLMESVAVQAAIAVENARLYTGVQQELTERKRAEDTLRQRDEILQAVANAAQVFLQSSNWRESITQTLDELGNATDASHVYIFENHVVDGKRYTSQRYEWTSRNAKPEIDNPSYQNVLIDGEEQQYWSGMLSAGRTVVGHMDALPKDEAEYFQARGIKSILDVPIFVGGEWWGVIGFDDYINERAWSPAEIEALEIAAKMISAAIENERLFERERNRADQQESLRATLVDISGELEMPKLLQIVLERAVRLSNTDVGELAVFDEGNSELVIVASYGLKKNHVGGRLVSGEGTMGQAIAKREAFIVNDYQNWEGSSNQYDEEAFHSALSMPLFYGERLLGAIALGYLDERKFTPADMHLLSPYAMQTAIAMQNAKLFESTNRQLKEMRVLHTAVTTCSSATDENALITQVVDVIRKNLYPDSFSVLLWDESVSGLRPHLSNNAPISVQNKIYDLNDGIVGTVAAQRKAWRVPDVRQTSVYISLWENTLSELCVPMLVGERLVGVINLESNKLNAFSEEDERILSIIAGQLAVSIERLRSEAELEKRVEERTKQLQAEKTRIEQVVDEVATLRRLSDFLQSSMTVEEASNIVASHLNSLFAKTSGGLYLINDGFIDLALMSSWGDFRTETVIQPNDCWGMRRGRPFARHHADSSPACTHFDGEIPGESLCLPLMGQNEIIGMLCMQVSDDAEKYFTPDVQNLAIACADSIALALANLRLRERLHNQSVRDPLTGLFNRRYLEETLARETHRASRSQSPLCVIMFEVDDFKRYNNTFGHDAGDYVLRKVADTMRANLRRSDFPCRYGGDEFTLLLPETTLEDGANRAEELRKSVEVLALSYNNQALGQVTVRMGVAAYPKHGETGETVLKVADDASYRARAIGKNCVVVAE